MKFLQLNLNHCRAAQDLLHQTSSEHNIDLAILSEPYKSIDTPNYVSNTAETSAIWTCSKNPFFLDSISKGMGYVRAFTKGISVFSCYMPPSWSIMEFGNAIDELVEDARLHSPSIIAGDFNAWAVEWQSQLTNARGRLLLDAFDVLNLVIRRLHIYFQ